MTTAVLGASGYVGAAVLAELARGPGPLRAVARHPGPVPRGVEAGAAARAAPGELARAVAGADVVVNLVARLDGGDGWRVREDDALAARLNRDLTTELIALLAGRSDPPPVLVLAGSTAQAGTPDRLVLDGTEEDRPRTPYDRQKLAAERELLAASAAGAVRGTCLRLPTVVGRSPGPAGIGRGVLATMVRRAAAGEPLTVWGDGSVRRDFLDVSEAASAFAAAVRHPDAVAGRHWVVGTGVATTLRSAFRTVAAAVAQLTGRPPVDVLSVPPPDVATVTDLHGAVVDPRGFREQVGWSAVVPVELAVRRMAAAVC